MNDFHPKNLLAGVDLTPASGPALSAAAAWARHYHARAAVVLAARSESPWEFTTGQIAKVQTESRGEQKSLRQRLEQFAHQHDAGTEWVTEVVEGRPEQALAEAAARYGAELLVFGLHRQSQTSGLGVEGLPFELMHHTGLPLLAVTEAAAAEPAAYAPRQVLALLRTGGEPGLALDVASAVAESWQADLSVLAPCAAEASAGAGWEQQCRARVALLNQAGRPGPAISFRPNLRPADVERAARQPGSLLVLESEPMAQHHWFHPEPEWEHMLRGLRAPALVLPRS